MPMAVIDGIAAGVRSDQQRIIPVRMEKRR